MVFKYYLICMALFCAAVLSINACKRLKAVRPGHVIILNGPSAVGKSTAIKAFQGLRPDVWLGIGIDNFFVGVLPSEFYLKDTPEFDKIMRGVATEDAEGKLFTLQVRENGQKVIAGMHEAIAAYARAGNNVIVDYIMYCPEWRSALLNALKGIPVTTVGVTASLKTIQQRESSRKTSPEGHARSIYESVHVGWAYDLYIDTDNKTPQEVAGLINQVLLTAQ